MQTVLLESGQRRAGSGSPVQTPLPPGCGYVMFTSGTAGRPKAVLGSAAGLAARCQWGWEAQPFEPDEVCVQKTAGTFVDSLWETLGRRDALKSGNF